MSFRLPPCFGTSIGLRRPDPSLFCHTTTSGESIGIYNSSGGSTQRYDCLSRMEVSHGDRSEWSHQFEFRRHRPATFLLLRTLAKIHLHPRTYERATGSAAFSFGANPPPTQVARNNPPSPPATLAHATLVHVDSFIFPSLLGAEAFERMRNSF